MGKYKLYKLCCDIVLEFIKIRNRFLGRRKCYICGKTFFSYLPVYGDSWYQTQVKNQGINLNFAIEHTIDGNTGAHIVVLLTERALSWHIFIKGCGIKGI